MLSVCQDQSLHKTHSSPTLPLVPAGSIFHYLDREAGDELREVKRENLKLLHVKTSSDGDRRRVSSNSTRKLFMFQPGGRGPPLNSLNTFPVKVQLRARPVFNGPELWNGECWRTLACVSEGNLSKCGF